MTQTSPHAPKGEIAPVRAALRRFSPDGYDLAADRLYEEYIHVIAATFNRNEVAYRERPVRVAGLEKVAEAANNYARALRDLDPTSRAGIVGDAISRSAHATYSLIAASGVGVELPGVEVVDDIGAAFAPEIALPIDARPSSPAAFVEPTIARTLAMARRATALRNHLYGPAPVERAGRINDQRDGPSPKRILVEGCFLLVAGCFGREGVARITTTPARASSRRKKPPPPFSSLISAVFRYAVGPDAPEENFKGSIGEVVPAMRAEVAANPLWFGWIPMPERAPVNEYHKQFMTMELIARMTSPQPRGNFEG